LRSRPSSQSYTTIPPGVGGLSVAHRRMRNARADHNAAEAFRLAATVRLPHISDGATITRKPVLRSAPSGGGGSAAVNHRRRIASAYHEAAEAFRLVAFGLTA